MERNNSGGNRMMMRRQSTRIPVSDPDPIPGHSDGSHSLPRRSSLLQRNASCLPSKDEDPDAAADADDPLPRTGEEEDEEEEEEEGMGESTGEGGGNGDEGGGVRMSLMSLLAETDREMGIEGGNSLFGFGEDEEEDDDDENVDRNGGEYNNCCVCMVRHKGAACAPCGHTFCRLCSRELGLQRGNCPLCNGYILEILEIF